MTSIAIHVAKDILCDTVATKALFEKKCYNYKNYEKKFKIFVD